MQASKQAKLTQLDTEFGRRKMPGAHDIKDYGVKSMGLIQGCEGLFEWGHLLRMREPGKN